MKKGDLVCFHAKAWVFASANKDYKNPGVILRKLPDIANPQKFVAEVFWADGRITREHNCYLAPVGEIDESR